MNIKTTHLSIVFGTVRLVLVPADLIKIIEKKMKEKYY